MGDATAQRSLRPDQTVDERKSGPSGRVIRGLSPLARRMARRIREVAELVAMRRADGVFFDPFGVALVVADAAVFRFGGGDLPRMREFLPSIDDDVLLRALHDTEAIIEQKGGRYRPMTGAAAGKWAGLTLDERIELDIRSLDAIDESPQEKAERRRSTKRAKDRERQRTIRAGKHTPRAEYRAASLANARPWVADGVSERTWYRRRKCSGRGLSLTYPEGVFVEGTTDLCHEATPSSSFEIKIGGAAPRSAERSATPKGRPKAEGHGRENPQ